MHGEIVSCNQCIRYRYIYIYSHRSVDPCRGPMHACNRDKVCTRACVCQFTVRIFREQINGRDRLLQNLRISITSVLYIIIYIYCMHDRDR